jgi:FKBP-type peptidyl-prolyl cis-trans isomerase FkpA
MKFHNYFVSAIMLTLFFACGTSSEKGFTETESGLKYKFHVQTGELKPELEDILSMTMVYGLKDSVLFDTRKQGIPMFLEMLEPEYPGDIYEGLAMMSLGDSATFILDAESFFLYTAGMPMLPPFIEPGSSLHFEVKLLNIFDEQGFMEEQQRLAEEEMLKNEERADAEEGLLDQYLLDENVKELPRASGLYYIEIEEGTGQQVAPGNTVAVHYEGRLLDGTVFDSSYDREQPLEFVVGRGQVIPGWDEGIGLMKVGGKARLVIPSHIGYGERGAGQVIPPFSTLIFDVELVDIK